MREDPRVVWERACEAAGELAESVGAEDAGEATMRAARELLALSRRLAGVACPTCRGAGSRCYSTTAAWHSGAGGATPTIAVCDRCWGSGRRDERGPSLRECESLRRERDEARAEVERMRERIATQDDAEQAIHSEAFMERDRIFHWIRARVAHASDRVSMQERGAMIDLANAIERGEHAE